MCKYIKIIWEISRVFVDLYSKVTYFIAWEKFIAFILRYYVKSFFCKRQYSETHYKFAANSPPQGVYLR
jgi:hypothetical protein